MDEFSAVSRRLPIWRLYERARSLGLAVQVSAQSWEGLAGSEDERQRVAATAEGGIWLLRTPRPAPVAELAGTLPALDTSRRFSGAGAWGGDGLSRVRRAPVLDGDLVRRLDVGQVCYVYRGGVTFLQIKRLTGRQPAIGRGQADRTPPAETPTAVPGAFDPAAQPPTLPLPVIGAAPGPGPAPVSPPLSLPPWELAGRQPPSGAREAHWPVPGPSLPDVSEVLDEAFGEAFGERHE
jgi:hypothetical protein